MAFHNPKGRANYEPNSWGTEIGGPRETAAGFESVAEQAEGAKQRLRPESFADHYSQARQFFISQSLIEQRHIGDALVFELSKVEVPAIRERVVSHLLNIDEALAQTVADGLGLKQLPAAAPPAVTPRLDLPASDALSILKNPPATFKGRKLGVLITDGVDAALLDALQAAVTAAGGTMELIAPSVAGITAKDGTLLAAHHKIDGGPSVLFDAVAVLPGDEGVLSLLKLPASRDFVADAYAHYKFIGFAEAAKKLFAKVGLPDDLDDGFIDLATTDAAAFIETCTALRFWDRPDGA
jgi:catalase